MQTAKRILLVEDDQDDQEFFTSAVETIFPSIECVVADDGQDALEKIVIPPPYDLIFMDLNMPRMGGFHCIEKIKSMPKYSNIPIVVLSTSTDRSDKEKALELGAVKYFVKPTEWEPFVNSLRNILSSPH